MSIITSIVNAIKGFLQLVKGFVKTIVTAVLDFVSQVVDYFRNLKLNPQKDIPFVANAEQFKEMIHNAPRKNVGIFEGVYNEETEEITEARYIAADGLDQKTKTVLGDNELVVLS